MPKKNKQSNYTGQEVERFVQQARQDLLNNVTHELLTQLTTIRLFAEILLDDLVKDPQMQQTYYRKIITESKHMEQLVNDLRELSDLQNNRQPYEKTLVSVYDLLGAILTRHLMHFIDTEITLNIENLDLGAISRVYTDSNKFIRVFNILLDHAVRFAGQNGAVNIEGNVKPQGVTFCIRCKGDCIPETDTERLLCDLYHPDSTTDKEMSRVEFAIANQIVKGLEGKLWAERSADDELAFYFSVAHKVEVNPT